MNSPTSWRTTLTDRTDTHKIVLGLFLIALFVCMVR